MRVDGVGHTGNCGRAEARGGTWGRLWMPLGGGWGGAAGPEPPGTCAPKSILPGRPEIKSLPTRFCFFKITSFYNTLYRKFGKFIEIKLIF